MAYNLIIADNSPVLKKICLSIFPEASFNLHFANNLEELNQLLDNLRPEALILSSSLFESLDGLLQLNSRLIALGKIPVFLIGGTFDTFPKEYLQAIKADKVYLKPFYSESLAEDVKETIEKTRVPDTMPEELPDSNAIGHSSTPVTISPSLLREVRLIVQQEVLETERELEKRLRSNLLYEVKNIIIKEKDKTQDTWSDKDQKEG